VIYRNVGYLPCFILHEHIQKWNAPISPFYQFVLECLATNTSLSGNRCFGCK